MPGPEKKRKVSAIRVSPAILQHLAEISARREPAVLVTVIESSGSAPGKLGAKMIVTAKNPVGTVGGGKVEHAALAEARRLLGSVDGPVSRSYELVQDLGMSCGGTMRVLFEPMTPPPRLVIFGAGHIAEALCRTASLAGFDVVVADERTDRLTPERFPAARERYPEPLEQVLDRTQITSETFVVCVTHGHARDQSTVLEILKRDLSPRYLGVIGSRRKATLFRRELVEHGVSPARADALRIPMGVPIGAVDPGEIAISIVAELIAEVRGVERES